MNFYQHHIGDYDSHTAHLSWLEDAAYRRLICLYYRTESPIPEDKKQVHRLLRASSKAEKNAIDQVLEEFFDLHEDGWHSARCDEELEKYLAGQEGAEERKAAERERQERHRQRRKELFEQLREHGIVMPYDTKTNALVTELSRVTGVTGNAPDTAIPITKNQEPSINSLSHNAGAEKPIPEHFDFTDDDIAFVAEHGLIVDLVTEVTSFVLYHREKQTLSSDWRSKFQGWLLRSKNHQNRRRA